MYSKSEIKIQLVITVCFTVLFIYTLYFWRNEGLDSSISFLFSIFLFFFKCAIDFKLCKRYNNYRCWLIKESPTVFIKYAILCLYLFKQDAKEGSLKEPFSVFSLFVCLFLPSQNKE